LAERLDLERTILFMDGYYLAIGFTFYEFISIGMHTILVPSLEHGNEMERNI
jgi:hypothetical protein